MRMKIAAVVLALLTVTAYAHAAEQPAVYRVQLKTGGPGFLLSCTDHVEQCTSLGPRLCPGKTAMWSNTNGTFSNVPVTMRKNGPKSLMIVKCE